VPNKPLLIAKKIRKALLASATITKVVPITGKQMINLVSCNPSGSGYVAEFKFNFLGADGLYWAEGTAKVTASGATDIKMRRLSPNLTEASAKTGINLTTN
jgi:hypothetical protein